MPDFILQFDTYLFHLVNSGMANPALDFLMPIITDVKYWIPVYIGMFALIAWRGGKNRFGAMFAIMLAAVLADQINSNILKDLFDRPRPCHIMTDIRLLVGCGGGRSFPSSHAANNFALATVLTFFYGRWKWWFYSGAALVAFSRTYVGVHYPLDLLGGAVVGLTIGWLSILIITQLGKLSPKIYISPD
ncbi:MAG: phosphatase PAP2 family protein [Bacteroidota bacterium]